MSDHLLSYVQKCVGVSDHFAYKIRISLSDHNKSLQPRIHRSMAPSIRGGDYAGRNHSPIGSMLLTGIMNKRLARTPVFSSAIQVIGQMELQPGDPIGLVDWRKIIPFKPAASSERHQK